jgi:LacI family transcriptional regulator
VRTLSCDGLILVPVGAEVTALSRDAESRRIPTVLFGRTLAGNGLDAVTIDNFAASCQATNYLIDLGHKRIGAITGPPRLSTGLAHRGHAGRHEREGVDA